MIRDLDIQCPRCKSFNVALKEVTVTNKYTLGMYCLDEQLYYKEADQTLIDKVTRLHIYNSAWNARTEYDIEMSRFD